MSLSRRDRAMRSIKATQKYARNRDPGYAPTYLSKLDDGALEWLADFEAAANGHKAPADRLGLTPEMRKELASDRYSRDEYVFHSGRRVNMAPADAQYLIDKKAYEGKEHVPFTPGTAREAKRAPKKKLLEQGEFLDG